jgi:hypothetical protein
MAPPFLGQVLSLSSFPVYFTFKQENFGNRYAAISVPKNEPAANGE